MLSKNQREIMADIFDIITNLEKAKKQKQGFRKDSYSQKKKDHNEKEIERLENELNNYKLYYTYNYRSVMKHRVNKKANRAIDDLILFFQTYKYLHDPYYSPVRYDKLKDLYESVYKMLK